MKILNFQYGEKIKKSNGRPFFITFLAICLILAWSSLFSQIPEGELPVVELKKLSLEGLMNIEVTSVAKRPQKLPETASAIQVITQKDIRSFGITTLAEALRLAGNLAVAQTGPNEWAISARGFNATLANKLLVLIDGRTVYTPLFAGVWWDIQDVFLEDVDRIEVISGPGGTLWGANAVNGVINIITKHAKETQGGIAVAGGGNKLRGYSGIRYGGTIDSNLHFRVYGKYSNRDATVLPDGMDANNDWYQGQGGFRLDWIPSDTNLFTLQGDIYASGQSRPDFEDQFVSGGNILARWSHTFSEDSDFRLQVYFDHVRRKVPASYIDEINTYDIDFQHRIRMRKRHSIIWGAGYRLADNNFKTESVFTFNPPRFALQLYSIFAQDEIDLKKDVLTLTVGSKVQYNNYTGLELQPTIRVGWKLDTLQFFWGAISRAVRMPSRVDRDFFLSGVLAGGAGFDSEVLIAYELGYRLRPRERLSFSLATFYHDYDGIRSLEPANPPATLPEVIDNGQAAESYGAELSANYQLANNWRLQSAYTILQVNIWPKSGSVDTTHGSREAFDAHHLFNLRSIITLPGRFELAPAFRFVSRITNPVQPVPGYAELDVRLAWQATQNLELSVIGRNLLHKVHAEFGNPLTRDEIQRSFFGKILWEF